jgi:hypothetical protein
LQKAPLPLEIAARSRNSPNSLSANPLTPLLLPSPSRIPPPPPLPSSLRLPPPPPLPVLHRLRCPTTAALQRPPAALPLPLPRGGSPRALSVVAARSGAASHVRGLRHPPCRVEADTPGKPVRDACGAAPPPYGSGEGRDYCDSGWRRRPSPPPYRGAPFFGSGEGAARSTGAAGRAVSRSGGGSSPDSVRAATFLLLPSSSHVNIL